MIDLSQVKVNAKMLREWKKARDKDPLNLDDMNFDDIAYAYYLMEKQKNPTIKEEEALEHLETGQLLAVAQVFFPALATPPEILKKLMGKEKDQN